MLKDQPSVKYSRPLAGHAATVILQKQACAKLLLDKHLKKSTKLPVR